MAILSTVECEQLRHRDDRTFLALMIAISSLTACAQTGKPHTDRELRGMGMVVDSKLAAGAHPKKGLYGMTDAGNYAFGFQMLGPTGGGISSIGGGTNMSFPRWVRVRWREGDDITLEFSHGEAIGGTVVGDYKVEVLSRIPDEVFRYANSAPGRGIRLSFRIKDDGVLLAWDVQENLPGASGFLYAMHGGDFPCETSPYQSHPNCTNGPLKEAPWYSTTWER